MLEVGAARLAASRTLPAPERDLLWRALEEVTGADPADYRRLDSRLHLVIAEITGVRSLVTLVATGTCAKRSQSVNSSRTVQTL